MRGRPRITIDRAMIAIAVVAVVVWLAIYETRIFVILLFVGINAYTFLETRPSDSRKARPRKPFRFSIWQIMAATVAVAGFLAIVRGVVSALTASANPGGASFNFPARIVLAAFLAVAVTLLLLASVGWYLIAILKVGFRSRPRSELMFGLSKKERWAKIQAQPFPPEWSWIMARNVPIYAQALGTRQGRAPRLDPGLPRREGLRGVRRAGDHRRDQGHHRRPGVPLAPPSRHGRLSEADHDPRLSVRLRLEHAPALAARHRDRGAARTPGRGLDGGRGRALVGRREARSLRRPGRPQRRLPRVRPPARPEDGSADGAPVLPSRNLYSAWGRVLGEEYQELRKAAETGKKSVLDTYGATEPAEFFAVATEAFFEKPRPAQEEAPGVV